MPRGTFAGFANPAEPQSQELRTWAYHPDSVPPDQLPPQWDVQIATDRLISTLFSLALDSTCPARRFAIHCLYVYAARGVTDQFRQQSKRQLRQLVEYAERRGDDPLRIWAHNTRVLLACPQMFREADWYEGGLARNPRRLGSGCHLLERHNRAEPS